MESIIQVGHVGKERRTKLVNLSSKNDQCYGRRVMVGVLWFEAADSTSSVSKRSSLSTTNKLKPKKN